MSLQVALGNDAHGHMGLNQSFIGSCKVVVVKVSWLCGRKGLGRFRPQHQRVAHRFTPAAPFLSFSDLAECRGEPFETARLKRTVGADLIVVLRKSAMCHGYCHLSQQGGGGAHLVPPTEPFSTS